MYKQSWILYFKSKYIDPQYHHFFWLCLLSSLLREMMGAEEMWPYLLAVSGIPAILQFVTLLFFPEAPRYLYIDKGDTEGTRKDGCAQQAVHLQKEFWPLQTFYELSWSFVFTVRPKFSVHQFDLYGGPWVPKHNVISDNTAAGVFCKKCFLKGCRVLTPQGHCSFGHLLHLSVNWAFWTHSGNEEEVVRFCARPEFISYQTVHVWFDRQDRVLNEQQFHCVFVTCACACV